MPGFVIGGTGGEPGIGGPNSLVEVRRTHRWLFTTLGHLSDQGREVLLYLKTAQRPQFTFEDPSMHHNQEQVYYAGKHTWEPISMTWYDIEQDPDVSAAIYAWLQTVINIANMCVAPPNQYKDKLATLSMVDGCGATNEEWTIYNGWPKVSNWNGLDYSSTDLQLVEVTYRYDRALKTQ